jgi:16S rRNA A1518/A1519 N6-dimethyltransferase RsmA/KsgA/DIM1 with predicted DNA glycosylase/AP lyase activity
MAIIEDPEDHELTALEAVAASFASRRVLEVGCGDGRLTKRYAHDAASVVAIDPDADAIAELRLALPRVDARAIGVEELDLPEQSVDLVLFAWSL